MGIWGYSERLHLAKGEMKMNNRINTVGFALLLIGAVLFINSVFFLEMGRRERNLDLKLDNISTQLYNQNSSFPPDFTYKGISFRCPDPKDTFITSYDLHDLLVASESPDSGANSIIIIVDFSGPKTLYGTCLKSH